MIKQLFLFCAFFLLSLLGFSQVPGDTIKVKTFHYGSNNRDTLAVFPSGNLTYEKIIMKYSMRCKNGWVSTGTDRNLGCGEWDYSCNTYVVDSSKVEAELNKQPNYVISNFQGSNFPYTSKPVYDYFDFKQKNLTLNSIGSDSQFSVAPGNIPSSFILNVNERSGKSQFIYTAAELSGAGLTQGPLQSLLLTVSNTGGKAGFFRLKIKHTDSLNTGRGLPETIGFTEVFNSNYAFVNGLNRILFATPFNWNGTQNILVEFSFTNAIPNDSAIFVLGSSTSQPMGLLANNNYALDLSNNGHVNIDTNLFSTIRNEITLAFWAFGNASMMPSNTSILYGTDANSNNRQLNIHLPHGSNNVYFDCGFSAGNYDRINQTANFQDIAGKWNHWVFTKNAQKGTMKIFLNGKLWLSGSGKTKPMTFMNMILGKDQNLQSNYKGKINDFSIWNKEIPDSIISTLMNQSAYALTNYFNNLVAYYPMTEGGGQTIQNQKNFITSSGLNLQWTFDRGDRLTKGFRMLDIRPAIIFTRGSYNFSVQTITVRDSIKRNTNIINQYAIISKAGVSPLTNDLVNLVATSDSLYHASSRKIYDGDSDTLRLLDSLPTASEGAYVITNLNYFRRYPFYNEIMSFVTPYGIGVDFGINGKSWYYDVTDFAPLLKGNKRIVMTLGGQNQEQNDIEFWFVVGTPVRNVLAIDQIWQGTNRTGAASIGSINNETRFQAVDVPLLASGKYFKIRSSITGHGSEGEFEQNGGPVDHMLKINGNTAFNWRIVMECSQNPVFPQGGTWLIPRQGWCPGQSSLLKEHDLTNKVTAGNTISIDYNTSLPQKSGSYNYQVAHQLVTYGNPNFSLDARIMEVLQPSDKIEYGRKNPVCTQPSLVIQNSGSTPITKVELAYWINQNGLKQTYTWTGNLNFLEKATITLPIGSLWTQGMLATGNRFYAEIKTVNNQTDAYALNNTFISPFNRPEVVPGNFLLDFRTNNNPGENSYRLLDENGKELEYKVFPNANTTYTYTYALSGCFTIVVEDSGEDGLSWWANTSQGNGFMRLRKTTGQIVKSFQGDFGKRFEYRFTTDWLLNTPAEKLAETIKVYPNPGTGKFTVEGPNLHFAKIRLLDVMGKEVSFRFETETDKLNLDASQLGSGMYFVHIDLQGETAIKQLLIFK